MSTSPDDGHLGPRRAAFVVHAVGPDAAHRNWPRHEQAARRLHFLPRPLQVELAARGRSNDPTSGEAVARKMMLAPMRPQYFSWLLLELCSQVVASSRGVNHLVSSRPPKIAPSSRLVQTAPAQRNVDRAARRRVESAAGIGSFDQRSCAPAPPATQTTDGSNGSFACEPPLNCFGLGRSHAVGAAQSDLCVSGRRPPPPPTG